MTDREGLWHRLTPRARRVVRGGALWVLTGALAAGWGVTTASFAGSVGPHSAQYSTTLNHEITFKLGPLGSLIIDSPLPLRLGVDIQVEEIPEELTVNGSTITAGPDQAVAALTADLESYTQFFTSPSEAIAAATHGLVMDGISRTILMWSILLTGVLLGRLAAHGVLRAAAIAAWRRPGVAPVVITLAAVGVLLPIVPATEGSSGAGSVSAVLQGTPLEDARITGRLAALIDHYGKVVVEEIENNVGFYDDVAENLREKFEADGAVTEPAGPPLAMPTVAAQEPRAPAEGGEPPAEADPLTMVIVSDLHCNVGMGRISGMVADLVEADVILDLGDDVIGGTSVERFCIDSFAESFADRPVVVAGGNHDSDETAEQQRAHGWHVLDGDVIEIGGVRFLGDDDPTLTTLGAPTRLVADENLTERGHRLATLACEKQREGRPVDILMMHNHRTTEEALDSGCVKYAFSGHFHRRIGPWQRGLGVQYLHTSTAGAIMNNPTIGPLNGPAGITVMTWDRANKEPIAMRVVRAMPDTSVELSPWYSWPEPPAQEVHLPWPTPQEAPWP